MDREEVAKRVKVALDTLYWNDVFLLENNSSEWSISHKLAVYLQRRFPRHAVDHEYNREPGDDVTKELRNLPECGSDDDDDEEKERTIRPDIIVHERGHHEENLLVIEVKKQDSWTGEVSPSDDVPCDDAKLRELTDDEHDFDYDHGLFVGPPIFGDGSDRDVQMMWYPEREVDTYQPINY